jgi:hypothetical protein
MKQIGVEPDLVRGTRPHADRRFRRAGERRLIAGSGASLLLTLTGANAATAVRPESIEFTKEALFGGNCFFPLGWARAVRGYLVHVAEQAEAAHRQGLSFAEAADTIDLGEYADCLDAESVVVNVYQRYRELDSDTAQPPVIALLTMQAEWLAKHGR